MNFRTKSFNKKAELEAFVNSSGIPKENIISIFQDSENMFVIWYFE